MDCEALLENQADRLEALENNYASQFEAKSESIRSLQAELARYRRAA
jgi:hypothetical protein